MLLPSRQGVRFPAEPVSHTEIGGDLPHAAAQKGVLHSRAFSGEGQLVPHAVGDDLLLGELGHEAHGEGGLSRRQLRNRLPQQGDLPLRLPTGGQLFFDQAEQGALSRAGFTHEHGKAPRGKRKGHVLQNRRFRPGIGEGQAVDIQDLHRNFSLPSPRLGRAHSTPKQMNSTGISNRIPHADNTVRNSTPASSTPSQGAKRNRV